MKTKRKGGKDCKPDLGTVCHRTVDACEIVIGDPPLCRECAKGRGYKIDPRRVLKCDKEAMRKAMETIMKCVRE